ncbi:MAG: hypothetical protein NWF14_03530 [Candidatus Bathyarchaeota archaeon]|nr:hypothetical protein [Candidatus Bathyarchaeota archaeon]
MPKRARWYPLYEEDEDFRLWFDNLARGSPTTAIERARVLYRFLGRMGLSLDELTGKIVNDTDKFEKQLMAFVGRQEKKGYAPGTIEGYLKSVRSWANWHSVELKRKIKISNRNATPTLDDEQVPTPRQVEEIRSAASPRGRVCVDSVAYAGLRPEILGHQHIDDGLKLGDLPELNIKKLEFSEFPTLVEVRSELSKAGHKFRTFFFQEVCRDIKAYLQRRRDGGEELTESSPLVSVKFPRSGDSGHIVTTIVSRDMRKAMRPTYKYRPYVLRSFFSTRLLMAVSDGVLDNNYRVYWMGQKGEMAARYSTNKAQLPPDLIENMREAFRRARPYLLGRAQTEEEMRRRLFLDQARLLGFEDEAKEALERTNGSVDKAIEEISSSGIVLVRIGDSQKEFAREQGVPQGAGDRYLVVTGDDALLEYVKNGWTLDRELEPEAPKKSVGDEDWVLPSGETVSARDKIAAFIDKEGSIELRGKPEELDEITAQLQDLGVVMESKTPPKRYLLKKNPQVR